MNSEQKESIYFYGTNDYLIINSIMWGNMQGALNGIKVANQDAKAVIKEALEQGFDKRWGVSLERGQEIFDAYKRRTPDEINSVTIQEYINRAEQDIKNIYACMEKTDCELILYRNVRTKNANSNYEIGEKIKLKSFSSSSMNIIDESYSSKDKSYIQYVLKVPKGTPILRMDKLPQDIRNEDDEILLSPVECVITNVMDGKTENCKKIIELTVVKSLEIKLDTFIEKTK